MYFENSDEHQTVDMEKFLFWEYEFYAANDVQWNDKQIFHLYYKNEKIPILINDFQSLGTDYIAL